MTGDFIQLAATAILAKPLNRRFITADKNIRELERELFASMAKGPQPMEPDFSQMSLEVLSSLDFAGSFKAKMKERFPGLTPSQLDELANF